MEYAFPSQKNFLFKNASSDFCFQFFFSKTLRIYFISVSFSMNYTDRISEFNAVTCIEFFFVESMVSTFHTCHFYIFLFFPFAFFKYFFMKFFPCVPSKGVLSRIILHFTAAKKLWKRLPFFGLSFIHSGYHRIRKRKKSVIRLPSFTYRYTPHPLLPLTNGMDFIGFKSDNISF